jgi:hypothetical protein
MLQAKLPQISRVLQLLATFPGRTLLPVDLRCTRLDATHVAASFGIKLHHSLPRSVVKQI